MVLEGVNTQFVHQYFINSPLCDLMNSFLFALLMNSEEFTRREAMHANFDVLDINID